MSLLFQFRKQKTLWCLVEISMWGLADAYFSNEQFLASMILPSSSMVLQKR